MLAISALLCALTACIQWPGGEVTSKDHPKLLYEKAVSAVEQGRFDVSNLTLQTLVNTYPDSEYASKARELLEISNLAVNPGTPPDNATVGERW